MVWDEFAINQLYTNTKKFVIYFSKNVKVFNLIYVNNNSNIS